VEWTGCQHRDNIEPHRGPPFTKTLDINVEIRSEVSELERMVSEAEGPEHN